MKSLAGVGVFLAVFAVSTWATTNTIQIFNFDFGTAPSTHVDPTINVGDTVEWVWASGSTGHSTTTAAGQSESWDSGVHTQPNTFTHTFANAGTFNYYCTQHGANPSGSNVIGMSGHVVVQAPSTNQDVKNFIAAAKGQMFEQLTAGAPTLMTTGFAFHADVRGIESNSIFASSVQVPAGAIVILTRDDPNSSQLEFNDQFTTKTTLDNTYHSSATYTQTIDGLNQGTLLAALTLPADAYPTTPQIVNFTAAQSINSATNFVLTWNAFSGGTASDFISLAIDDNFGAPITNTPDLFAPGVLNGSATSVTIPGGTLAAGTTYQGRLLFVKVSTTDSNSIAGAIGGAGFFKETSFSLATVAPPGVVCALSPALATNDVGTLHTVTATITSNGTALAGVDVNFDVIAGPNTGTNGFAVTDIGGHAGFSYAGAAPGTDTIQASGAAFNCTAAKVWLGPNVPPVAVCQNVVVAANASCQANVSAAQVDNNSSDPDGSIVSRTLSPSGPYALGATPVTLTVTDNRGATNSCSATITVLDQTPPVINCPANIATNVPFGVTSAVVNFVLTASDNCSLAVSNSTPASGSSFALGTTTVTNLAIDAAGNTNSCNFNVTVTQVAAQADLALSGSSSVATASLNSTFSYSFIVTNKGPQAAVNIEFLDGLTAGVSYISSTSSVGNVFFDGVHLRCHLG
ncbi:MAG: HYR domain-containing protein, partial [Verrucomicrobiota bacterium]